MTARRARALAPAGPPVRRRSALAVCISCLLLVFAGSALAGAPPEPPDYRMDDYRAPTPATLSGATVLTAEAAHDLWLGKAARFIDVLPRPPKPKNLPEGTLWRDKRRDNIPGSIWLVNVGFGALSPEVEAYFRDNLDRVTGGDKAAPIVLYCLADCWMSWNAAKRAVGLGYRRVYWFPEGTDGWLERGWPVEESTPAPME